MFEGLWRWRESNPRPHKETIRFLHAYLSLCFRGAARPEPPTTPLSPKFSSAHRGIDRLFPIYLRRLILGFGTTSLERRLVLLPCKRIKLVIYCTSIKQREHTRCCQLIFRPTWLWSPQSSLRMLTYHFILPSNPVKPMIRLQRYKKLRNYQMFFPFFLRRSENTARCQREYGSSAARIRFVGSENTAHRQRE